MKERAQRWNRRFAAIIRCDGQKVDGFMTNLSNEGMEIRAKYRLNMGDEISIRIITPEEEVFHYLSEVRWWRPAIGSKLAKGLYRYGLRHMAVDPDHARLVEMVKYDSNRRKDQKRIPLRLPIDLISNPEAGPLLTENVSIGGAFVRMPELPPPYRGEMVSISMRLPDSEEPLIAKARVIHMLQPLSAQKLGLPSGVGLHFLDLSSESRKQLLEYLQRSSEQLPVEEGDDTKEKAEKEEEE